jgi:RNA polymerase sigma factor (TIGR02999 family)
MASGVLLSCWQYVRRSEAYVSGASHEITRLLQAWTDGDREALDKLTPLVHQELHRLAHRYMLRERRGHTLQTTALINEVYIRLVNASDASWQDRAHFFAVCAGLMRRILTDYARSRRRLKRGGGAGHLALDEALVVSPKPSADLVALDDALNNLAAVDLRKSQVAELRFFGGLSVEETADVLKVSAETVTRDWRLAKVWLLREIGRERRDEP